MRVFVSGVNGQLGRDVAEELLRRGHEVIGSDLADSCAGLLDGAPLSSAVYAQLDITDDSAVKALISRIRPEAVIHCAAWTAVDAAEDPANRETVFAVNAQGTRSLAEAAKSVDAAMLYLSTDYVFDGQGTRPWAADDTCFAPLNVYGQSKLAGEMAVSSILEKYFIVRIAWVFGRNGKNFIRTMIGAGKTHSSVRVVNDQIGTPTYTRDLAPLLADMIESDRYGYYHATNSEAAPGAYISWYDLCVASYRLYGLKTEVIPVSTAEYGLSKAARPANSRLDKGKLAENGFTPLPVWEDAVRRYLKEAEL